MKTNYTADDCYSISSYLNSAAVKFEELAKQLRAPSSPVTPGCESLAQQFDHQAEQARKFASRFMGANNCIVEEIL